ncbi:MAG: MFS transporter [Rhodospirillaceae bacterium]|jgi:MFS family permease|nr:MFS transporter [Rhodospirillaceae bacterium]MBT5244687.1 MFS transporter [Rhodospirillaceae bacterium]MBT5562428.1 MFS transporter [Rhodospirillaceae bacterium]MBT6242066.1 MFS transporter [Rhodospirillaceae bacterium]
MNTPETEPVYRWVIVFASAIMLAVSMGMMVNGFSAFLIPLNDEFGWQRGSVSLINLAGLMGLALGGIVMGRIADRTSTRRVCLLGAVVMGLSVVAASQAQELWQFYLLFFLAGFLGAGSLFTPLIANTGNWFKTGAGLAIGIASAGQALGQGAVPFGIAILISNMGWRDALMTMGMITLAVLIPLAILIRQPPKTPQQINPGADTTDDQSPVPLPANAVVAWLGLAVLFCCICMSVPLMHLLPLIHDRGFSLEEAGSVVFVMMVVAILGRVAFGKLADMIGAIRAYWIASCWQTVMVFGFIQIESLDSFYIYAVIYGFGYAGVMTGVLICVRVLTPLARRASALGIVTLFGWLGHAIGGYQGGYFFDISGDYTLTYANAAFAGVINLIIVTSLYVTITRRRAALAFVE